MFNSSYFHPMTVHFPIALIMIGFIVDLVSVFNKKDPCLSKTGYYMEIFGMIAAIVAFGTGYYFTSMLSGEAGLARIEHKLFATFTLVFIILASTFRVLIVYLKKDNGYLKWVALGLFLCAFIFVIYTGHLGGMLVEDYLMGI
ncbi:MAG: hypothetical protein IH596_10070 [Bacteroidales bacterium]|nr:hypothetical protein [Bacteroidales bacterium]